MRTGQIELEFGANAALERAGQDWVAKAYQAMAGFCHWRVSFTADDLVAAVGMPPGLSHNAVGAVIRSAAKDGLIVDSGSTTRSLRPDAHGRKQTVWRAA